MREYDPQTIEAKWQKVWAEQGVFHADADAARPKYYLLEMLPYPSGTLHMGHMRNYTIGDAVARYKRMRGFNVIHPIGWDSFGLPAENAAIKHGTHPRIWTNNNIAEMKKVCHRFGFSYDWRREISTCEPEYYRWNQWFFLRMLERGLAYRKRSRVNWCSQCQTVLANEQVVDGCCWRHEETQVEAKDIEQWFLKTTAYADELLDNTAELAGGWPERVLVMQRNWVGRSAGARVRFEIAGPDGIGAGASGKGIEVFTTRIDTIYGANAVILAADHPLLPELIANAAGRVAIEAQLRKMRQQGMRAAELATTEKEGIFTGRFAVNPFSGEKLPIWVANFVLMEYGTGAVMSVPAHDQRDFEFTRKYALPFRVVVQPLEGEPLVAETMREAFDEHEQGTLVNSGPYNGLLPEQAIAKMTADAEAKGFGRGEITYRLKDWGISRQRYWGTPIPVVYCDRCGMLPVPDDQLPVLLPPDVDLTGMGQSPLARAPEFVNTKCPKCGGAARRETDTMDTFVDSSWYFYRYTDPRNDKAPFDPKVVKYWFSIDQYIGGIEHAILHLIYSRFFCKVMRDLGLVEHDEPVKRLFSQGMVHKDGAVMSKSKGNLVGAIDMAEKYGCDTARLYTLFAAPPEKDLEWSEQGIEGCWRFLQRIYRLTEKYSLRLRQHPTAPPEKHVLACLARAKRELANDDSRYCHILSVFENDPLKFQKIGRIRKALNLPDEETARDEAREWIGKLRSKGVDVEGKYREGYRVLSKDKALLRKAHQTVKRVTQDLEVRWHFNASVALLMELVNELYAREPLEEGADPAVLRGVFDLLILMLAPMAPHIAEEMWEMLGHQGGAWHVVWPRYDSELAREKQFEVVVQVNGKVRGRILVEQGDTEDEVVTRALADPKVAALVNGKRVVKKIVVPNKLVNIVVA